MRPLADLPIKHKLTLISLITTSSALVLAGVGFVVSEAITYKQDLVDEVATVAEMVGYNSASALAFDDAASAKTTLGALAAKPHIVAACIYDRAGNLFATYARSNSGAPLPSEPNGPRQRIGINQFEMFQPIRLSGEVVGTIYVNCDFEALRSRLWRYATMMAGLTVAALFVAQLILRRVQRMITTPLLDLAAVAGRVAEQKDYAVRAAGGGRDEIGRLVAGFNAMLGEIQSRESALRAANEGLEQRVAERTAALEKEITERRGAELRLANSLSLLHATLESTADGILVLDLKARPMIFNRKLCELWQIEPVLLVGHDGAALREGAAVRLVDPAAFSAMLQRIAEQPELELSGELDLKGARVFEYHSRPQMVEGVIAGRVWCYRDITARRRAEEEVERSQRELVDLSRRAGMADVATEVLHNVGNVLNSLNVSTTIASDQLKHSRVAHLAKLAALLAAHREDLADFLAHDARGQIVPEFVGQLAEALEQERTAQMSEVENLCRGIDHIKEIVAQQLDRTAVVTVIETVALESLVDDAVKLCEPAISAAGAQLKRDLADCPLLDTDRHKAMQMLTSLLRNALAACVEAKRDDAQISLRLRCTADRAIVEISDNGAGIAAEDLPRVFQPSFGPARRDHGCGLHSCALAAAQVGGTLTVQSAGPGCGATFSLELPLHQTGRTPPGSFVAPSARN